ncbi:MAG: hypothetical protein JNK82_34245 [Myxococcaceae bacterium]|nr:hypothetical protein [Myxococcaceae bacterium]
MRALRLGGVVLLGCGGSKIQWEPIDAKERDVAPWKNADSVTLFSETAVRFGTDPDTGRAFAEVNVRERQLALQKR